MLQVLLVDDEPLIRDGLASIIDWNSYGYQVIDTADSGRTGLEKIRDWKPDVVFVDIRMPGISGIEMVQQAKEEGFTCKFVVLSGYSNFSYAQQAIRLGMESYLLKPIDEEELIPLLERMRIKLNQEKVLEKQLRHFGSISESSKWKQFLFENNRNEDWLQHFRGYTFYLASMTALSDTSSEQIASKLRDGIEGVYHYLWKHDTLFLLFRNLPLAEVKQLIHDVTGLTEDRLLQFQLIEDKNDIDSLPSAVKDLHCLQQFTFAYGDLLILTENDLKAEEGDPFEFSKWLEQVCLMVEFDQVDKLDSHLTQLQNYYQMKKYAKDRIIAELIDKMKSIYQLLSKSNHSLTVWTNEELVDRFTSTYTLADIIEEIKKQLLDLAHQINGFVSDHETIIDKMKHYVDYFYAKELNVKVMADLFNYNPSYLGKKFKAETGSYFHQYLDAVRITKAKELLVDGSDKVYQVSEKVGYTNQDYFYRKFKYHVGISPKEFQKQSRSTESIKGE
ncbi:response regulator transcription factor [Gracilibacillus caseinilyticus]|uniref:Response regulator transcription factor n=1 Tax=Gracilibacillus caseinilyticus TaxID=2932256 RepID=A0ABY4F1S9_9BACI|nr:response regulator transcription factor [Gracilibacillus caseinilyticus]UOQ48371.1 response regulator transcription factor [Gracilibacillus caseinilyticus]